MVSQIDGLMQERRNSIANALELRLSCTNSSKSPCIRLFLKKNLSSLAGIGLTGSVNIKSMSDVITDQHRIPMWPGIAVWGFPRSQNHIISSVPIMRKITILNSNLREFCKYPPPPPPTTTTNLGYSDFKWFISHMPTTDGRHKLKTGTVSEPDTRIYFNNGGQPSLDKI